MSSWGFIYSHPSGTSSCLSLYGYPGEEATAQKLIKKSGFHNFDLTNGRFSSLLHSSQKLCLKPHALS